MSAAAKYFLKILFIFPIFLFILIQPCWAEDEFSSSYFITYHITTEGITHVKQSIDLKNNTDDLYITEYSISIGSTKLSNIIASDNFG